MNPMNDTDLIISATPRERQAAILTAYENLPEAERARLNEISAHLRAAIKARSQVTQFGERTALELIAALGWYLNRTELAGG